MTFFLFCQSGESLSAGGGCLKEIPLFDEELVDCPNQNSLDTESETSGGRQAVRF